MNIRLAALAIVVLSAPAVAAEPKPFPGVESRWNGFVRHDFQVKGLEATVVEPAKALPGRPWIWRGEFFGVAENADVELLKAGWHLASVGASDLFGSPKAMDRWEKFYETLVKDHQLSIKPGLIGLSRGGLYCLSWAADHPHRTLGIYLDNAVCDFRSWPGGKLKGLGIGKGSAEEWAKLLKAFDFRDDAQAISSRLNPIDRLPTIASGKIPILLVYGDSDQVVPHMENSDLLYNRYRAIHAPIVRIVKPGADHHPHGLTDPEPIVRFFTRAWQTSRRPIPGG